MAFKLLLNGCMKAFEGRFEGLLPPKGLSTRRVEIRRGLQSGGLDPSTQGVLEVILDAGKPRWMWDETRWGRTPK